MNLMEQPIIHVNLPWFACESLDDDNQRRYHTKVRILRDGFNVQVIGKGSENIDQGFEMSEVVKILLSIPGVIMCQVNAYSMIVVKSPCFTWAEIEPRIYDLLYGSQLAANLEAIEDECLHLKRLKDEGVEVREAGGIDDQGLLDTPVGQ